MSYYDLLPVFTPVRVSWGRTVLLKKPTLGMMLEWMGISKTLTLLESCIRTEKSFKARFNYAVTIRSLLVELAKLFLDIMPRLSTKDLFHIRESVSALFETEQIEKEEDKKNNPNWVHEIVDYFRYHCGMKREDVLDMYLSEVLTSMRNVRRERQQWACTLGLAYNDPKAAGKLLNDTDQDGKRSTEEIRKMEAEFLDRGKNGK